MDLRRIAKQLCAIVGFGFGFLSFMRIGHATTQEPASLRHNAPHAVTRRLARKEIVHHHASRLRVARVLEHHTTIKTAIRHAAARHLARNRTSDRKLAVRRSTHERVESRRVADRSHIHHRAYLWCVPYARDVSHIELTGDAFLWWAEAAGRYARGIRPVKGAVLNFRSSQRMRLGHVAVVAAVLNSREILVDQANWKPDQVTRDVPVIDVSPENNWSEVRVALGNGRFGSPYPTYGFIYNRAPEALTVADRASRTEVAEAPAVRAIQLTAPNRRLQ